MKANHFLLSLIMIVGLFSISSSYAINVTKYADAPVNDFLFIENNNDNNYFVTPLGYLDPRMTGASKWTGLQYLGSGSIYQQSLGYIDNGFNFGLHANWKFDMWLENVSVSQPLLGLRCINWYSGCNINTSLILPQSIDEKGFYGATVTPGNGKWMHGLMSDSFYQYLRQMALSSTLTMEINGCQTSVAYDATKGERCKNQASGNWYSRTVNHRKGGQLNLKNTNSMAEVFINSDGIPLLGEGNSDCKTVIASGKSGLMCKMVNYTLESSANNISIHIFPALNNNRLSSAITTGDFQFSLDGNRWKNVSTTSQYYTFNEMKSSQSIYIFMSSNFFKQMVRLGISDTNTRDLFNFRFQNTTSPESGWYEFSTSTALIIKPRDFGISIISKDYQLNPHQEGKVEKDAEPLNFDYIVTTSGITAADLVQINVSGPSAMIGGKSYCEFSSPDNTVKVPFPGYLTFTTQTGKKVKDAGCNSVWYDMTDALWTSTPWTDASGDVGFLNKTTVSFSIPMDNKISERTVSDTGWFGSVSASGFIHVQATWRNIK